MAIIEYQPRGIFAAARNFVNGHHHPEHIVVQPAHFNGEGRLPSDLRQIFEETVPELDGLLSRHAQLPGTFVEQVHPSDSGHPRRIARLIAKEMSEHPDIASASLLWGAMPQYMGIREEQATMGLDPDNRSSLIRISGSSGTSVGVAELDGSIPEHVLSARYVILHDDVIDSAKHATVFIHRRLAFSGKDTSKITAINARLNSRQFSDQFETDAQTYQALAIVAQEAGVVFAVPFYKNKPFLRALTDLSHTPGLTHEQWADLQSVFVREAILFDQFRWLMGEGLDTDIPGSVILPDVRDQLQGDSALPPDEYGGLLSKLPQVKLRVGSFVPGLIALDESRKNEFFTWVGNTFGALLSGKS